MGQSLAKQDLVYQLAEKRVSDLLESIASHLNTSSCLSDNLIHDLRVCVKRLRALLQLYRPCCDKGGIKQVEQEVKAVANAFASQRDTLVQYQLLCKAINEISEYSKRDFSPLHHYFEHILTEKKLHSSELDIDRAFKHALKKWRKTLKLSKRKKVNAGLSYTHDICFKLSHRAIATGKDALYHECRKWLKYYQYQLKL